MPTSPANSLPLLLEDNGKFFLLNQEESLLTAPAAIILRKVREVPPPRPLTLEEANSNSESEANAPEIRVQHLSHPS